MCIRYLVVGSKGQLGKEFTNKFKNLNEKYFSLNKNELDITNLNEVLKKFEKYKPNIVINCSAYNLVDKAEEDNFDSFNVNSIGVYNLVLACKKIDCFLIHYSSDYIFDGLKKVPYTEKDIPNPLNEYGKSKLLGEKVISNYLDKYLIFRLSWVYGEGEQNFIFKLKSWSKSNNILKISNDEISVPTSTKTIVDLTLKAIEKNLIGIYNLINSGYCSRFEWAKLVLDELGIKKKILPISIDNFNLPAKRSKFSAMSNIKISNNLNIKIESWQEALLKYLNKL